MYAIKTEPMTAGNLVRLMPSERLDIRLILGAWGKSRSIDDAHHLDYPHVSIYCQDSRNSGNWAAKLPDLSEDHHIAVDREVSDLKTRNDNRYPAIVLSYIHGARDKDIGRVLKCSTSSAREARIAGENWLDARVEINLEAL